VDLGEDGEHPLLVDGTLVLEDPSLPAVENELRVLTGHRLRDDFVKPLVLHALKDEASAVEEGALELPDRLRGLPGKVQRDQVHDVLHCPVEVLQHLKPGLEVARGQLLDVWEVDELLLCWLDAGMLHLERVSILFR
jgi:hypothetical protein